MIKRITDITASEFQRMDAKELAGSIRAAEGRTIAAEVVCSAPPLVDGVTNAELAAAMGADIIILNRYNVDHPVIYGLPSASEEPDAESAGAAPRGIGVTIREVKRLIGRPVGVNLEPARNFTEEDHGRLATPDNARKAVAQGADILFITGTPGTGVTNEAIASATQAIRDRLGDRVFIVSGKPVGSGIASETGAHLITPDAIKAFCAAGCDAIALPMPGASPGWTTEAVRELVSLVHRQGALAWLVMIGSVEGSSADVIHRIALEAKMTGADVHEIGEGGFSISIAVPENIMEYSIALRGRRHTYRRMAMSPLR
ncbi:MAG: haloacid dehalogenase-like hydrolase [Chloroflexi bacterium]|nr:haloacid dehalogenase-like hydrolase [Chloroflexota bacterium]